MTFRNRIPVLLRQFKSFGSPGRYDRNEAQPLIRCCAAAALDRASAAIGRLRQRLIAPNQWPRHPVNVRWESASCPGAVLLSLQCRRPASRTLQARARAVVVSESGLELVRRSARRARQWRHRGGVQVQLLESESVDSARKALPHRRREHPLLKHVARPLLLRPCLR